MSSVAAPSVAAPAPAAAVGRSAISARLDRLPIGAFHRRVLMLIGIGMFFDSFDIYLAGSVLGVLVKEGWSTMALNAQFISGTFIGMVFGAAGAGYLGDRFGRKFTYQFNLGIFGLASLAAAVAPSMTWLIAARFVSGVGLGAEIVIGYATLIEFVPPGARGRWAAWLSLITNFGLFVSTLMSWLIVPLLGWRAMFVIAGLGALFVLYLRKSMPESPRWLEVQGRFAEAEAIVAAAEAQAGPLTTGPLPAPLPPAAPTVSPSLWQGRMLRRLALGSLMSSVMGIAIYGFIAWVPTLLVQHGMGLNRSLGQSVLMSLGGPAGALIGVLLNDRVGRRRAVIVGSLLAAVCGWAFAQTPNEIFAVVIGFTMFTLIYYMVSVIVAGYVPELFPTASRMRGAGICGTAGRLTTVFVPFVVVALHNAGGVPWVLGGIVTSLLLQAAVIGLFAPETTRRSLEQIAP